MSSAFNHILSAILIAPLAGALVLLCLSGRKTAAIRWLANAFAGLGFLVSLPLWFLYEPLGKTWQFAERGELISAIGASYYLGVDGLSILLILLTTLMGWIAILASWNEIKERVKEFYVCMLVLQTGMLGTFMALDFLLFFLFLEVMLVAMYFVIRIWGGGPRLYPAIKFLLVTLAGSVVLLLGILTLYFYNHSVTGLYLFDITQYQVLSVPFAVQKWVFLAFFLGFAVKVPMFPFHSWLPDAQTTAPTAGSVMLAAVLLKVGTYGFLRFCLPMLPDASRYFAPTVAALAIVGIVYGALVALAQSDWKRLVAYSSVSSMALTMLGMFALTPAGVTGSMVQQINHGISIGALFLLAGFAYERRRTREIAEYRRRVEGDAGLRRGVSDHVDVGDRATRAERVHRRDPDPPGRLRREPLVGHCRSPRHRSRRSLPDPTLLADDAWPDRQSGQRVVARPDAEGGGDACAAGRARILDRAVSLARAQAAGDVGRTRGGARQPGLRSGIGARV